MILRLIVIVVSASCGQASRWGSTVEMAYNIAAAEGDHDEKLRFDFGR